MLILSLVLVIMLAIVLYAFQRTVYTETVISQNRRMAVAASWAARGGITVGMANLEIANHADYDSLNERWAREESGFSLGDAEVKVRVVDEARKFNVLALIDEDEEVQAWAERMLEELIRVARNEDHENLGSNEVPADRIVENIKAWLEDTDGGAGHLSFGGGPQLGSELEDDTDDEITKTSPFPILTASELMMVRGVNRELLYGPSRREFEERPDPDAPEQVEEEEEPQRQPLLDFITCYGTDPRRININTAPREVLLALDEDMTEQLVEAILEARERETDDEFEQDQPPMEGEEEDDDPYAFRREHLADLEAFKEKLGEHANVEIDEELFTRIRDRFTVRSHYFTVIAVGTAHDPSARRDPRYDDEPVLGRMEQTWRAVVLLDRSSERPHSVLLMIDREYGH